MKSKSYTKSITRIKNDDQNCYLDVEVRPGIISIDKVHVIYDEDGKNLIDGGSITILRAELPGLIKVLSAIKPPTPKPSRKKTAKKKK